MHVFLKLAQPYYFYNTVYSNLGTNFAEQQTIVIKYSNTFYLQE